MTIRAEQGRRFRAPSEDGKILSVPDIHSARRLALSNSSALDSADIVIAERSLAEMRTWTRAVCITRSVLWMQRTLGTSPRLGEGPLFVTGHQPSLNHPGVWMKNVAVAHLARCSGTTGMNLIVDNDIAGPSSVRVPTGSREEPRFEQIPYDVTVHAQPWEERRLHSAQLFDSFAERVEQVLRPWNIDPCLTECWPAAVEARSRTNKMAPLLTACRVAEEKTWDIENLELPVSELCQTEPFLAFTQHLIQQFESFFTAYNSAVHRYRRHYHIRNDRHPVPDLEQQGSRLELPFWYWEPGETGRHRLFASRSGLGIDLFAGDQHLACIPSHGSDVTLLHELQNRARLRTRALTTTLFTRLCLSDLFVHGIGGAKYDEITDRIIQNFFGIAPPGFLTLTATLRLPLGSSPVTSGDLNSLRNRLRKLQIEGPTAEGGPEVVELRKEQAELIASASAQRAKNYSRVERRALRSANRQRHLQLKQGQQKLAQLAEREIQETEALLEEKTIQLRANGILNSREFPTCLFPRETLQPVIDRLRSQVCMSKAD